jgi:hypothetical protein
VGWSGRAPAPAIDRRGKPVEVEHRPTVDDRMADLNQAAQTEQGALINLVPGQQFGVIVKVAQEPAQFPQGFYGAVQSAGDDMAGERAWFKNGQPAYVKLLASVPMVLGPIYTYQVNAIGNFACHWLGSLVESLEPVSHAAPSLLLR